MAVSRTLLHAAAMQDMNPAECLAYANRVLRSQADNGIFTSPPRKPGRDSRTRKRPHDCCV